MQRDEPDNLDAVLHAHRCRCPQCQAARDAAWEAATNERPKASAPAVPAGWKLVPVEATHEMIDAPRGLVMYFNGMGSRKWTLGQHADAGGYGKGYAHLLTDEERASYHFPKAHQAWLVWRAMISAATAPPEIREEGA